MRNKRLFLFTLIFIMGTVDLSFGQKDDTSILYLRTLGVSFSGGANYMLSDFNKNIVGYVGGVNLMYLFPIQTHNTSFGIKGEIQYGRFKGREEYTKRTNGIVRFSTDYYQAIGGLTFNVHFNGYTGSSLELNAMVGAIFFNPKTPDGYKLPNNKNEMYVKNKFILYPSLEYKLWMSSGTSFNIEVAAGLPLWNDYLDDVAVGAPDYFFDVKAGFSFYLLSDYDEDGDGVPDDSDECLGTEFKYRNTVLPSGCPSDKDYDGVYDEDDKCPNTPKNVEVDSFGCPIDRDKDGIPDYIDDCPDTAPNKILLITSNGCSDEDQDGVPDYMDQCPNTSSLVKQVDSVGCALDLDKDGIPDYRDKCKNTPLGYIVNENGCPLDNDNDGVRNNFDRCDGELETYNFKDDFDGCPDVADYRNVEVFSPSSAVFDSFGQLNENVKNEIILYLLSWYDDYPETFWIIEVSSKNNSKEKAKVLKEFFDSYTNKPQRTRIKYSNSNRESIKLLLDVEKAKSQVINSYGE